MEITFSKEYLCELYETGKTKEKKYRFQPQVIAKYRKTVDVLESVANTEELYKFKSLHFITDTIQTYGLFFFLLIKSRIFEAFS